MNLQIPYMTWSHAHGIQAKQYVCGYCDNKVASAVGYVAEQNVMGLQPYIYVCPNCTRPSHISDSEDLQIPGIAPGNDVDHLPDEIGKLYNEARQCVSINSHTAAVLTCRKLLMNIAVSQGAEAGKSFISYVKYLSDTGYVPPNGKGWVDHIRKTGNEANHEIKLMGQEDAEELIAFSEMLLKFIYEFPAKVPKSNQPSENEEQ